MKRSCNFSDSDNESLPKRSNLEAVQYSELGLTDVEEHGVERYEVVESSNTSLAHNVIFESVFGSFHQGSDNFSETSRGRQYVANALISILYRVASKNSFLLG